MRGVTPVLAALARRFRLPRLPRNEAAPLGLLLLALASVFAFGGDRSQFYRPSLHDDISAQSLTLAANLSAEHRFLGFRRRYFDDGGEPRYVVYHRFPVGSYVLVKLAILPAGDGIPGRIAAARLLMLAFFAASAVLAYLALARLIGDRRIALAATLLAFSSYYLLYYNDMISAEASTNLFGVMLVFHGMVAFAREGRFRQLIARTAVALLLGWHVVGLVAPFVLLGLASEAWRARGGGARLDARRAAGALARSRYLAYGALAALGCALLFGFNLASEYLALGGEAAPADLPSFRSLLRRTGSDEVLTGSYGIGWLSFLRGQLAAVGAASLPYAALQRLGPDLLQPDYPSWPPPGGFAGAAAAAGGAAVLGASLAALRCLRWPLPAAALLLAGWGWAVPFRASVALHEFEGMFHAGVPLIGFALALLGLRRLAGRERAARALPAIALAALALFVLSARDMGRVGHGAEAAALQRDVVADVEAIRELADGRSVIAADTASVLRMGRATRNYWWRGSYLQLDGIASPEAWARTSPRYDFFVAPADLGGSLTPGNRRLHLYRLAGLPAVHASIAAGEPAQRAAFDVRLGDGALTWTRGGCAADETEPPFFVRAFPADASGLPAGGGERGFEEFRLRFRDYGVRFDGVCMARFPLPDYALAGLRTGQRIEGLPPVWEASLPVEDASFPRGASSWRGDLAAREPALRGPFAVYLNGRALHYLREDCAASDVEARFFLHVTPLDPADLPEERRAYGFDNLDFAFGDRGLRYEGACLASVALPDYAVARIRTGQFDEDGEIWEGEFAVGDR